MIIGLPDAHTPTRACDTEARRRIRPHGSRVFSAPPREALDAPNYQDACTRARAATGKAISKQCWYLFPKIRELATLADPRLRESHPELVFARFNAEQPIHPSKKTAAGREARLSLIEAQLPRATAAFHQAQRTYLRRDVALDDLLDALALCAAAQQPSTLRPTNTAANQPQIWY